MSACFTGFALLFKCNLFPFRFSSGHIANEIAINQLKLFVAFQLRYAHAVEDSLDTFFLILSHFLCVCVCVSGCNSLIQMFRPTQYGFHCSEHEAVALHFVLYVRGVHR